MSSSVFRFKKFSVDQEGAAHPVGTDGVLLGAWADCEGVGSILDIGTGTGLIALMLAQRTQAFVHLTAIDIHHRSVVCAAGNFRRSPWPERLEALETALQAFAATSTRKFDLIVSNPPFFPERSVSPDVERSMARHSGTLSLPDLLNAVDRMLLPQGRCCVILPEKEAKRMCELSVPMGLFCSREMQVRSKAGKAVERLMLQFERDPGQFRRETIEIYGEGGRYSEAYERLTYDFYLDKKGDSGEIR